jgi:hypothetical protein
VNTDMVLPSEDSGVQFYSGAQVAMPIMYFLLRLRILVPLTAILFGVVVIAISGLAVDRPSAYLTVANYTTCTVLVYLRIAHSQIFSNSRWSGRAVK